MDSASATNESGWISKTGSPTVFVFLHGILSSSRACWRNPSGTYWPRLVREDPRLHGPSVYACEYSAGPFSGPFDVYDAAEDVMRSLHADGPDSVLSRSRIIFVCHSQGGIVVRRMLISYVEIFQAKKIGLLLCGSPAWGSGWATLLSPIAWVLRFRQLSALSWGGVSLVHLDREFTKLVLDKRIPRLHGLNLLETRNFIPILPKIVSDAAASRYFEFRRIPGSTHQSLVKPHDVTHSSHAWLVHFTEQNDFLAASNFLTDGSRSQGSCDHEQNTRAQTRGDRQYKAPFQAPPLPSCHVDRRDLYEEVCDHLLSATDIDGALQITAMHGLGGVGKSTLAAAVAHSPIIKQRFPDGVIWLRVGPEPDLTKLLSSFLQGLGEAPSTISSVDGATGHLRTLMRDRAVLIVVDDVWYADHLQPFLVGTSRSHLLLTTRRLEVADSVHSRTIQLDSMTSAESFALLTKCAGKGKNSAPLSSSDQREAHQLAEQLGHHPLAMQLMGALIARGRGWADTNKNLLKEHVVSSAMAPHTGRAIEKIDACLTLSLEFLRQQDAALWSHFLWLAILPAGESIEAPIGSVLWNLSPEEAERTMAELAEDALLQSSATGYVLHSLLHSTARRLFTLPAPTGLGLTIQAGHAALLENYRRRAPSSRWDQLPDDGYIHGRLVWHMKHSENFQEIFRLLKSEDEEGRNLWFVRRDDLDQRSGYIEDLQVARELTQQHSTNPIADQLLWTLCISSVRSATRNIDEEVFVAIVSNGLWSPTQAYHWIRDTRQASTQPDLLVALARTILELASSLRVNAQPESRLRNECLMTAFELVINKTPTEFSVRQMARVVSEVDSQDKLTLARKAFNWCMSTSERFHLLGQLSNDARLQVIELLASEILQLDGADRLNHLVVILQYLPSERRAPYFEPFFGAIRQLRSGANGHTSACPAPPQKENRKQESASHHSLQKSESHALVVHETMDEKHSELPDKIGEAERERLIDTLIKALAMLPPNLEDRAKQELRGVDDSRLFRAIRNSTTPKKPDDDAEDAFSRALRAWNWDGTVRLIIDGSISPVQGILRALDMLPGAGVDRLCWRTAPALRKLDRTHCYELAVVLEERDKDAVSPRLLKALDDPDGTSELSKNFPLDALRNPTKDALIAFLCFGPKLLSRKMLRAYSAIMDLDEEVGAIYSLLPYISRPFPEDVLAGLRDDTSVGEKIAALTQIMVTLTSSIETSALCDMIETASKIHSEWWVVEAITMTSLHLSTEQELAALQTACNHIKNLDLKARGLSRIAIRMADLGLFTRAIEATDAIELPTSRWDTLVDLTKRLSSAGDFANASKAASGIGSSAQQSKAFLELAMELGAQGYSHDARDVIDRCVTHPDWKLAARSIIVDATGSDTKNLVPDRIAQRSATIDRPTEKSIITKGLDDARDEIGSHPGLSTVRSLVERSQDASFRHANFNLWTNAAPDSFIHRLGQEQRPRLLKVITSLAPLIGSDQPVCVTAVARAVRTACRWWH